MTAKAPEPGLPAATPTRFEGLAALLAPAAGCDCQMLAVTLADGFGDAPAKAHAPQRKIAER